MLRASHPIEAEVVFATPSELNHQYAQGLLDAGAMSSFFYLERDDLTLIPGPSISSIGEVGSVLFFSKCELAKLGGQRVAVPEASATSINLLRVLLLEQFGVTIDLIPLSRPDIADASIAGALVMGDQALTVDDRWSHNHLRIDMGAWWYETVKLPMVFGVWAASTKWADENTDAFKNICNVLKLSVEEGLNGSFGEVIAETQSRLPELSTERIKRYFKQQLNFDWSIDHQRALDEYRQLCCRHGLIDNNEKIDDNQKVGNAPRSKSLR